MTVGEPVTMRFLGDCAAGGRLMINGTGPGETSAYTDLWDAQITGSGPRPNRARGPSSPTWS